MRVFSEAAVVRSKVNINEQKDNYIQNRYLKGFHRFLLRKFQKKSGFPYFQGYSLVVKYSLSSEHYSL